MRMRAATKLRRALVRLGLIAVVVAAIGGGFARTAHAGTQYGIDVSSFQGTINWAAVATSGISFAYVRATDDRTMDGDFAQNWDGALAHGINPGAYLYFVPGDDPTTQVALLIQQLQTVTFGTGSLVPVIDIEETDGLSPSQLAAKLATAVNYLYSQLGVLPAIYTSPSWWDGNVQSSAFTADPLWVANWCGGCSAPSVPAGNWGGFGWQVWQYTSSGTVAGIAGRVDGDVANPGPPLFQGATNTAIHGPSAVPANSPLTVAAAVTPPYSSGTVSFTLNGAAISGCTNVAVSGGQASCHISSLAAGSQRVAADYDTGGGYFSSSGVLDVTGQSTSWGTTTGSPTTISDGDQQLVFWEGPSQHLYEAYEGMSTTGWIAPVDLTAQLGGTGLLASAPQAILNGTQQLVFWRGTNDHLWEAWYTPSVGWAGPTDLTSRIGGSLLASAPQVVITPSGQQLVFWGDHTGHLIEAWFTPQVGWAGPVDYTAALGGGGILASAPTVSLTGGQQLVFWRGVNNHMWESWFTPSLGWTGPVDYTVALGGAGLLASAPSMAITPGGQQLAFWAGTNNHLWEAWFTPGIGWSGPVDYTAQLGSTTTLAGSQPALALTSGGQQLVYWQGSNSHLWEAWFTPGIGWAGPMDWTTRYGQGLGTVATSPTLEITPDQQQLLLWQDASSHLWQALFDFAWNGPYDWTAA